MKIDITAIEGRRVEAKANPVWTGDLADDSSARWAGFLLRAEKMDVGHWWFAVTDVSSGVVIEDSATTGSKP